MSSLLGRKFDVSETISKVYLNAGLDHNLIERILTTLTNNDDQRYVICKTKTDEGLESQWEISRSGNQWTLMGGWLYYVKGSLSSFGLAGSDAFVFVKSGSPKAWRTMTDVSPYLDEYQKRKISETGELGNFLKYLMSLNEPFEEVDEPITFDEIHTNPTPKQPGKHWKAVTSVSELQPGCRLKISYNEGTEIDWSKYSENATRTMSLKDIKTSNLSLIYTTRDLSDTLDMFSDKDGFVAGYEDDPFSNESCCYMYLEEGYDGLMFGNEYGDWIFRELYMEFTVNDYDPEDEGWPLEPWMQFMSILVDDEPEPGPEPEPEPTEAENKKYKTYISRLKKFITKYQN